MSLKIDESIYERPVELLQQLIRFNTTNPPGHEKACIDYIDGLLTAHGIETTILAKDPERPNLVARLKGRGEASPLMLYGHVDVVAAISEDWKYPPFEGVIAEGCVWGRGTLDMKGAVAMMVSAFIRAKVENADLPGDVVLCILSDEEVLGEYGAKFMVENHPEIFKDIRFALGEIGGFTHYVSGKKFYLIEIAQKQKCILKAVLRGPSAHGSQFIQGGAMGKLGNMLHQLDRKQLPVHVTSATRAMFSAMADALPFPKSFIIRRLLNQGLTDFVLRKIMGKAGNAFLPLFHNTVNATVLKIPGGGQLNVIPGAIEVEMDVRILPGYSPDDVVNELKNLLGDSIDFEVMTFDPVQAEPDMAMFDVLKGLLTDADPGGIPVPLLVPGCSDGRFFSRLGIQTYGFVPMQLPEDLKFNSLVHSVDERIPTECLPFGTGLFYKAICSKRP